MDKYCDVGFRVDSCDVVNKGDISFPYDLISRWVAGLILLAMLVISIPARADNSGFYYDELGRLIEVVAADGTSTQYSYDAAGNITSVRNTGSSTVAISGFVPSSGAAGAVVTLYGSGFSTTVSTNVVKFNGVTATVATATATSLTVSVPNGATTGPISVTNGAASATSTGNFTVGTSGSPTVTNFTPTIGALATAVTVTGTNFQTELDIDKVAFGQVSARPTAATTTSMTTSVPTAAASGKLSVSTPYGVATSTADFFAVPTGYSVADVQFTGRLTGDGLTFSASAAGKTGLVLFDGTASQTGTYIPVSGLTMSSASAVLFAPSGTQIGNWSLSSGNTLALPQLPVTGTYTLVIVAGGAGQMQLGYGTVDLAISGLAVNSITAGPNSNYSIGVSYTVTNQGTLATQGAYNDTAYLSTAATLGSGVVTSAVINAGQALAVGQSTTITTTFTTSTSTPAGSYTLFVKTDGHIGDAATNADRGNLTEVNETNNVASTAVVLDSDLQISNLVVGTPVANSNLTWMFHIGYDVKNIGVHTSILPNWWDVAYLQSTSDFGSNVVYHVDVNNNTTTTLAPGQSYHVETDVSTSVPAGSYTLFVKTDAHGCCETDTGNIAESSETNNYASAPLILDTDLKISNLVVGTVTNNSNGSATMPVSYDVTNIGAKVTANASWWDVGYLQNTDTFGTGIVFHADLNTNGTTLAPGESYHVSTTFTTDSSILPGTYTLFVKTDAHGCCWDDIGNIAETNEANNYVSSSVTVDRTDLKISNLVLGTPTNNSNGSATIPVSYDVTNASTKVTANASWWDVGYLQNTDTFGTGIVFHADLNTNGTTLAPGESYHVSTTFTTDSSILPGTYTLFVKTDAHGCCWDDIGNIAETNEANNYVSAAVTVDRTDLKISNLVVGTPIGSSDGTSAIPVSYDVTNASTKVTANASWWDVGYLQNTDTFGTGIVFHADLNTNAITLAPGQSYHIDTTFTTPASVLPGTYTLFVKTDAHGCCWDDTGNIVETNEANNFASAPVTVNRTDLSISNLTVGAATGNSNGTWTLPVSYDVTNISTKVTANASWWDVGYLQNTDTFGTGIVFHADLNTNAITLAPGQSYHVDTTFTTDSSVAAGSYTLFVKTDAHGCCWDDTGNLVEANEDNNFAAAPVILGATTSTSMVTGDPYDIPFMPASVRMKYAGTRLLASASRWRVSYSQHAAVADRLLIQAQFIQ